VVALVGAWVFAVQAWRYRSVDGRSWSSLRLQAVVALTIASLGEALGRSFAWWFWRQNGGMLDPHRPGLALTAIGAALGIVGFLVAIRAFTVERQGERVWISCAISATILGIAAFI
jgi:hypothetical protein